MQSCVQVTYAPDLECLRRQLRQFHEKLHNGILTVVMIGNPPSCSESKAAQFVQASLHSFIVLALQQGIRSEIHMVIVCVHAERCLCAGLLAILRVREDEVAQDRGDV